MSQRYNKRLVLENLPDDVDKSRLREIFPDAVAVAMRMRGMQRLEFDVMTGCRLPVTVPVLCLLLHTNNTYYVADLDSFQRLCCNV